MTNLPVPPTPAPAPAPAPAPPGQAGGRSDQPGTDHPSTDQPPALPQPLPKRLALAFTQTFAKGLIAILPVGATIIVLAWFYHAFEGFFSTPIHAVLQMLHIDKYYISGSGFVLGMLLIFLLGLFLNALIVRQLLDASEGLLQRLPLAKTVMGSVRDVTGFFTKSEKSQMNQVVVVRLLDSGPRVVGFVTRQDLSDSPIGMAAPGMVSVFIPLSYAMGGYTLLVPRANIQPVDMRMEEAMRFVLTAGMKNDTAKEEPVRDEGGTKVAAALPGMAPARHGSGGAESAAPRA